MPNISRGDVVLLPIAFVNQPGTKIRPAVVVQNDELNRKLTSTVVAIITSTTTRVRSEPSQLFIDIATPDGQRTGLIRNSVVKCEHLDTINQQDIGRIIGTFSPQLMDELENCVRAALAMR